tara:strand:- start:12696 stop:13022 length:327 start_codon:yes stop_codon:yes gene_type:complete
MEKQKILTDLRNDLSGNIEERFPGLSDEWKQLTQSVGIDFPDDAKEEIRRSFLSIEGFGLNSIFVEVYAPYKFREELCEKIQIQFPDQLDKAKEYAEYILSRVTTLNY